MTDDTDGWSNSQGACWGEVRPSLTGGLYARFTDTAAIRPAM